MQKSKWAIFNMGGERASGEVVSENAKTVIVKPATFGKRSLVTGHRSIRFGTAISRRIVKDHVEIYALGVVYVK